MKRSRALAAGALMAISMASVRGLCEPTTLRVACIAPEGTAWARELKAFARDVQLATEGQLLIKWYLGGIAGDDVQVAERIRRDQLDGVGSGGMLCERLSPTYRAIHVAAQSSDEASFVLNRLHRDVDEELRKAGYVYLGGAGLGPDVLFTREPVRSLADLRGKRLWVWDLDEVIKDQLVELGVRAVPLPVSEAGRAYDENKIDGFVALPAAALAFQWSAQARYVTDLRMGFVSGCVMIAARAFDAIPPEQRGVVRAAGAKLQMRMKDLERQQDDALLGGLFGRQGLKPLPASTGFRAEYGDAARAVQEKLGDRLAPRSHLERVQQLLDEYRKGARP